MTTTLLLTALLFSLSVSAAPLKKKAIPTPVPTPAQDLKYEAAIDSLQELQSILSVGINQRDFGTRIMDLKIKTDKVDQKTYPLLVETVDIFVDANMIWNYEIVSTRHWDPQVAASKCSPGCNDKYEYLHNFNTFNRRDIAEKEFFESWKDSLLAYAGTAVKEVTGKIPAGSFKAYTEFLKSPEGRKEEEERVRRIGEGGNEYTNCLTRFGRQYYTSEAKETCGPILQNAYKFTSSYKGPK